MSSACALKCDIFRLVDKRWAGIAKGVGIQRIVGRIHMVQVIYKYLKLNLVIYLNIFKLDTNRRSIFANFFLHS